MIRTGTYVLVTWVVLGLCAEGLARLLFKPPQQSPALFGLTMSEPHPARVWQYKAHYAQTFSTSELTSHIQTRSWRLRDEDPVASAAIRILAIGDSFTFGWGVEESERFTEQLRSILQDRLAGRTVEVLNAGHWNYTFDQQLLLTRELLKTYRPSLVIQGVYAPHVVTIADHQWQTDERGQIASISYARDPIIVRPDGALRRSNPWIDAPPLRSRLLSLLARGYFRNTLVRDARMTALDLFDPAGERLDVAWAQTREVLRQMSEILRREGVRFLLFDIPASIQVQPGRRGGRFIDRAEGRTMDYELPRNRFRRMADSIGADWVTLLEPFLEQQEGALYFKTDPHWTAKGHRLAAELLASKIKVE